MEHEVVTQASGQLLQYGVLGVAVVVFGLVIYLLYRDNNKRQEKIEKEREAWGKERAQYLIDLAKNDERCRVEKETIATTVRAEYEKKHRETIEGYAIQLKQQYETHQRHEDDLNRNKEQLIERISKTNAETNEALVEMLGKVHDKLVVR